MLRIIDAKYKKSDLNKVMAKQCQHLSTKELERLLKLLRKFEDLFGGKLGKWKTTLLDLESNYDVKSVFLQPYPIPRAPKTVFKKVIQKTCKIGSYQRGK